MSLTKKIDFALVISVKNANPNGDPLNGNRPRTTYENLGEISDVCIKRKIRNRAMQMGQKIFVQSDDQNQDGIKSLSERFSSFIGKEKNENSVYEKVCKEWFDVRSFGQVFAFKSGESKGVSIGVRGPVSIQPAFTKLPIMTVSAQITKSVNSEPSEKKSSDTMGSKHRVEYGLYITYGSINTELAKKTGFSEQDAAIIKEALRTLFRNDASSARPEGSMEVVKLIWWEHNSAAGQYPSAKVHRSLIVNSKTDEPKSVCDFEIAVNKLPDLEPQIIEGE